MTESQRSEADALDQFPTNPQALIAHLARRWAYSQLEGAPIYHTMPPVALDLVSLVAFTRLVTLHCRMSGVEPDQHDLDQWLASAWPLVVEDMNAERWARAYLEALAETARESVAG